MISQAVYFVMLVERAAKQVLGCWVSGLVGIRIHTENLIPQTKLQLEGVLTYPLVSMSGC